MNSKEKAFIKQRLKEITYKEIKKDEKHAKDFKSIRDAVLIALTGSKLEVRITLSKFEEMMPMEKFVKKLGRELEMLNEEGKTPGTIEFTNESCVKFLIDTKGQMAS